MSRSKFFFKLLPIFTHYPRPKKPYR